MLIQCDSKKASSLSTQSSHMYCAHSRELLKEMVSFLLILKFRIYNEEVLSFVCVHVCVLVCLFVHVHMQA